MSNENEPEGIRGDELADDATGAPTAPDPEGLANEGLRGDGLADAADGTGEPDPAGAAEDGLRGDGLATDA